MKPEVARWARARAGAVLSLGRGDSREPLEWKQMKTKKKKKKSKPTRRHGMHNYLFLKGTGNKYISNDEKLEVADGGGAPLSLKSFLRMLSPGTN